MLEFVAFPIQNTIRSSQMHKLLKRCDTRQLIISLPNKWQESASERKSRKNHAHFYKG